MEKKSLDQQHTSGQRLKGACAPAPPSAPNTAVSALMLSAAYA